MRGFSVVLLFALIALLPATGWTQTAPNQPAPLFPRHHRGTYRDPQGRELIDATPQSPPLEIDDPGVPDNGEYEINLTTHADLSHDAQSVDVLFVDANYGLLPRIAGHKWPAQLKFEFPVTSARERGEAFTLGVGAATLGIKFNFSRSERSGLSLAIYPQIEFEGFGTGSVHKELAESGETLILPVLIEKETRHFIVVANAAVNKPFHDPDRETTDTFGIGLGRAVTRKVAMMIELRDESSATVKETHLALINIGVVHGVRRFVTYANLGHSVFSDDGSGHIYVGVGMKLMIATKN